ncbi:MAG: hypothetical protein WBA74_06505 [Cyclobacteriaceae bacterium]
MIKKSYNSAAILILIAIFSWSCEKSYRDILNEELESGVRYDSLFLGITMDMNRKDFYAHCWELNNKGVVINGPSNLSVEYRLKEELKKPGYLRFYPQFENDKIKVMDMEFGYTDWAPWNESLKVDSLMYDVTRMLEKWYGNRDFIYLEDDENRKVWVKIDGNRRIRLWKKDLRRIQGEIIDVTSIKETGK